MKCRMIVRLIGPVLFVLVFGFLSCTEAPVKVAGGGVETETISVSGIFTLPDNTPARGARVYFRPVEFLQGSQTIRTAKVRDTLTDANGAFQIIGIPEGEYALEINRGDSLGWFERIVPSQKKPYSIQAKLAPFAKVKGYVSLPDSAPEFFMQFYGLGRRFSIPANGAFTIPLPAGEYVFRLTTESSRYLSLEIPHVILAPGQDTLLAEISFDDLLPKSPVPVIYENNLSAGLGDAVALAAINTYYGRADIPIGILKGGIPLPGATTFYQQVLASQPDSSVVIVSVGSLENLYHLMN